MSPPWAKNPRALAGRLRRAQTSLRMLDIEIAFAREGRAGARMIRMSTVHNTSVPAPSEPIATTATPLVAPNGSKAAHAGLV